MDAPVVGARGASDGLATDPSLIEGSDQRPKRAGQATGRRVRTESLISPATFFTANAPALGVYAALVGGIVYVALTRVATLVCQPAGVRPSAEGLGYGPLLLGMAVTLFGALGIVLAAVHVAFAVTWLRSKRVWAYGLATLAFIALVFASWFIDDVAAFFLTPLLCALIFAHRCLGAALG